MKLSVKTYSDFSSASEFESVFPLEICQKYGIQPMGEPDDLFIAIYTPKNELYTNFDWKNSKIEETENVYRLQNNRVAITLYKKSIMAQITIF
jgi:hypothetical protein